MGRNIGSRDPGVAGVVVIPKRRAAGSRRFRAKECPKEMRMG